MDIVVVVGMPLSHPCVRQAFEDHQGEPRPHPGGGRTGPVNSEPEGLNSKVRLITHRGYGHHSAAALISMIYLCCGGITVQLPTGR
jgi:hypothetical protein